MIHPTPPHYILWSFSLTNIYMTKVMTLRPVITPLNASIDRSPMLPSVTYLNRQDFVLQEVIVLGLLA